MRPKKIRWVKCEPLERCFKPCCKTIKQSGKVYVTIDEYEAVRLSCLEELKHVDAAKIMKISHPTFSRILASALKNIADGLVNIKAICIEGGCCKISHKNTKKG